MDFSTEIQYLKGVGPARAEAFSKLGVDTVGALLRFYPRAYEDWSRVVPIREAPVDTECCIRAVVSYTPSKVRLPGGRLLSKTNVTDGIKSGISLQPFNACIVHFSVSLELTSAVCG